MSSTPVLIAITRTVRPGKQKAFERALHVFVQASLKFPGQMGVQVIRPAPGSDSREYGILRRFDDDIEKERFYASELYRQWERRIADLCEGTVRREAVTGLEAWFTLPGSPAMVPPPRWKMALIILIAVYPVTLVLPWALSPIIGKLNGWLAHLIVTVCVVATLTWMAMPLLTRLFRPWLHPKATKDPAPVIHSANPK